MINSGSIIGTWLLNSFATEFEDGTRHLPHEDRPSGRISYAGDGFMSAHLWNPDFHVDGALQNEDPHYFSYCGDWKIKGSVVRHHVHAATEPSWTGQDKVRTIVMRGDLLELTAENVVFGGKHGRGVLIWAWRKI